MSIVTLVLTSQKATYVFQIYMKRGMQAFVNDENKSLFYQNNVWIFLNIVLSIKSNTNSRNQPSVYHQVDQYYIHFVSILSWHIKVLLLIYVIFVKQMYGSSEFDTLL